MIVKSMFLLDVDNINDDDDDDDDDDVDVDVSVVEAYFTYEANNKYTVFVQFFFFFFSGGPMDQGPSIFSWFFTR